MRRWSRFLYQPGLPLGADGKRVTGSAEHIALARRAAAEGMVLLKNETERLPLKEGAKIALFGKGCIDYVKGGGGSSDVTVAYASSLYDGLVAKEMEGKVSLFHGLPLFYGENILAQYESGLAPGMTKEPAIPADLLAAAKEFADTAIFTICRFSGEGWDRKAPAEHAQFLWEEERIRSEQQNKVFPDGDFNLTKEEKEALAMVESAFDQVIVVLNIGGIMETAWIKDDPKISAALIMWQGGMEGGNAAADILCGDRYPSGKLADTFAGCLEDYPSSFNFHESNAYVEYTDDIYVGYRYFETVPKAADKVIYPFGYGLGYSEFTLAEREAQIFGEDPETASVHVEVKVTNIGRFPGKEVVQLYYSAPQGSLGKPAKVLGAFAKTKELLPGESEVVGLTLSVKDMASYDDCGGIRKSAYVLEAGKYRFFVGNSVRNVTEIGISYDLSENVITEQLTEKLAPKKLHKRMKADGTMATLSVGEYAPDPCIFTKIPLIDAEGVAPAERGRDRYRRTKPLDVDFVKVAEGEMSLEEFMAKLHVDDCIHLLGGQKNMGVSNTYGIGDLPEFGVPDITTADGPAGLRIRPEVGIYTTAWPCATMMACSFDPALAKEVGAAAALEVKENNIGVWLTPAVNIHRSPLCGRNFEYYSEDPYLAGKIGAGCVSGIQSKRIAATVKHFAFNNKETNRKHSDSIVSERAAREIYLKVFEIIVKEAHPWCIMTSYNKVNGVQASENAELLNGILRGEWGFDGVVMTDWWTAGEHYLETKAGNDLKMGNGYPERVKEAFERGAISEEEIRKAVKNILKLILRME